MCVCVCVCVCHPETEPSPATDALDNLFLWKTFHSAKCLTKKKFLPKENQDLTFVMGGKKSNFHSKAVNDFFLKFKSPKEQKRTFKTWIKVTFRDFPD